MRATTSLLFRHPFAGGHGQAIAENAFISALTRCAYITELGMSGVNPNAIPVEIAAGF